MPAMMPWEYADKFWPLKTKGANLAGLEVYVTEYKTGGMLTGTDKQVVFEMQRFFKALGGIPNSGVTYDELKHISLATHGIFMYPAGGILGVANGKGTLQDYRTVFTLFDYWLTMDREGKNPRQWRVKNRYQSAQQFADLHAGVDCNCFVGGYLAECYPGSGFNYSTDIPDFSARSTPRKSLADVANNDLVLFNHRHIAIVDEVLELSADGLRCWVAESRNPADGGAQFNERYLKLNSKGEFHLAASAKSKGELLKGIGKPTGVD